MYSPTQGLQYNLQLVDPDTDNVVAKFSAESEDILLEKLGAWERGQIEYHAFDLVEQAATGN